MREEDFTVDEEIEYDDYDEEVEIIDDSDVQIERRLCKKCKKMLPPGYKGKKCEACIGKNAGFVKKAGKMISEVGVAAVTTFLIAKKIIKH